MALGISVYFLSAVLPGAFTNFFAADTISWDAGTIAIWFLIPLAIAGAIVLMFVPSNTGS